MYVNLLIFSSKLNNANNLKKRKSTIVFNSGKETGTDACYIIVTLY